MNTLSHRGNHNTSNCSNPLSALSGAKSGAPMNPSLQQRINFLQNHLSQAPPHQMPSVATKYDM